MALNPTPSLLDQTQILQRSFDKDNDRLRVDAEVTANISGAQEVIINAVDDSIAIRSSITNNELAPNVDGSINVLAQNVAVTKKWDAISVATPDSVTEIYSYKTGGLAGTLVATVTVVYTDITKNTISSLVSV